MLPGFPGFGRGQAPNVAGRKPGWPTGAPPGAGRVSPIWGFFTSARGTWTPDPATLRELTR